MARENGAKDHRHRGDAIRSFKRTEGDRVETLLRITPSCDHHERNTKTPKVQKH